MARFAPLMAIPPLMFIGLATLFFVGMQRDNPDELPSALEGRSAPAVQLDQLGQEKLFEDRVSGAKADRPGLKKALEQLREGDTLVVWRLDRLGRSLKDLIIRAEELGERGVGLKSLQETIDTNSSGGQLVFHMFGALAQFERSLVRERTQAGLIAARARGRNGGRPKSLTPKQRQHAVNLYKSRKHTVKEICELVGVSRQTLYSYVEEFSDGP